MWPAGDTALCRASCRHLGLAMPDPRWLWSRVHCTRRQPPPRLCGDPSPTGDMCEWHVCFRVCGVCLCGHVTPDSWRRWASHCKLGLRGVPPTHRVFSSAVSVHVRPGNAGQVHCHRRTSPAVGVGVAKTCRGLLLVLRTSCTYLSPGSGGTSGLR